MPQTVWNFQVGNDAINDVIAKINNGMGKMVQVAQQSENAFTHAANRATDQFKHFFRQHANGIAQVIGDIPILGQVTEKLANPYGAAIAGSLALGTGLYEATQAAAGWETKMAEVNVTANLSKSELRQLSDQIMAIGRGSGQLQQAPNAFNRILSAGLSTNDALAALEPTLKAAKAGFTDLETVATAVAGVFNAGDVKDFTQIYDVLFATVKAGNASFKDIADFLPKILPGARAAGFGLKEVGGAYAFLTAAGFQADDAANRLANTFKAFSDQDVIYGTKQKKGLIRSGIQVFDTQGNIKPMLDIVNQLSDKVKGLRSDAERIAFMENLGFDMEAAASINAMMQENNKLNEAMTAVTNSTGQFKLAVENSLTSLDSYKAFLDNIYFIKVKLGTYLLPLVSWGFGVLNKAMEMGIALGGKMATAINTLLQYSDVFAVVIGSVSAGLLAQNAQLMFGATVAAARYVYSLAQMLTWTNLTVQASKAWAVVQALLNATLWANPIGVVVGALALLAGGLYVAYQRSATFRAVIAGIMAIAKETVPILTGLGKAILGIFTFSPATIAAGIKQTVAAVQKADFSGAYQKSYNNSLLQEQANKVTEQAAVGRTGAAAKADAQKQTLPTLPQVPTVPAIANVPKLPNIPQPTLPHQSNSMATAAKVIQLSPLGLEVVNIGKAQQYANNGASQASNADYTANHDRLPTVPPTATANSGNKTVRIDKMFDNIVINVQQGKHDAGIDEFEQKLRRVLERIKSDTSTIF